ncbi:MAG: hydrogenase formation protein HypD, partial [Candidatus Eisenbacteria bacterium]|nr:hydrogenase formation protein HypD [Candidatus Eisenbacteria bacterium]
VAISRYGLRSMLPATLRLLSGPGCPVCVTPLVEIDRAIAVARLPGVTLTTFGDMMRVPGSASSLEKERAEGADVRILYSPLEALAIAGENPDREIVFVGVGFETTSPTIAASVMEAKRRGVTNFSVLPFFKTVPPALSLLADLPGRSLDGFICPGHVSAIIGSDAYSPVARDHNIPCVVTGFEPLDILAGIVMLLEQATDIRQAGVGARVENQYSRAVTPAGNAAAQRILSDVLAPCDAEWREIGVIPESGLEFNERYAAFDARLRFDIDVPPAATVSGCICGEIMLGRKLPTDCALFGGRCIPRDPVGPCMVSTEGSCAAFYKYERGA